MSESATSSIPPRYRGPWTVARYQGGIGDELMLSAMARELKKSGAATLVTVITAYPFLFENNPHVDRVVYCGKGLRKSLRRMLHLGLHRIGLWPRYVLPRSRPPLNDCHPVEAYYRHLPFRLDRPQVRSELFLTEAEKAWAAAQIDDQYWIAVHSCGKTTFTPNKEWGVENFQALVPLLRKKFKVVQLGMSSDMALEVDKDLRGLPFRQSAAILSRCKLCVFQEGGLSHLANAVGTKCVILGGGFLGPNWAYPDQVFLAGQAECAPCFLRTPCPYNRKCFDVITPEFVLEAVNHVHNLA